MINTDQGSQFHPSRIDHSLVPVRMPVSASQNVSAQPQISQDLQKIFQKALIPLSSDSTEINRKSADLNDDFGLLVCEIHALFKAIHGQGVAIAPDFHKLDVFEQRLDELNQEVNNPSLTKKERKRATEEINQVKASIREVRQLAKELDTFHPLSLALGDSEAEFADRYDSDRPGSALLATGEMTNMLNRFSALKQNVFDPLREKADDDRVGALYEAEQEELAAILEDWSEKVILQTQEEIHEFTRCLLDAKEEDKASFCRQAMALDRHLTQLKSKIRNSKTPDPALKSPLQNLARNIARQQRELHKIIDMQESKDLPHLEYGKDEWLQLVAQRPKAPVSWLGTTMSQLSNPSEWNSTVKNVVKTLFDGILLFDNVRGMSKQPPNTAALRKGANASSFKADHFPAKSGEASISKDVPLAKPVHSGQLSNFSFILQAPSSVQSVPLEFYLNKKYEKLTEMGQSLEVMQEYLMRIPAEHREEIARSLNQLYGETLTIANRAPHALSAIQRADWMQNVDDLLYAKTVLEQQIVKKAVELKDLKLLAALAKQSVPIPADLIVTGKFAAFLEESVQKGQHEDVRDFLSSIEINAKNKLDETLVHWVAYKGLSETFKILEGMPDIDLNIHNSEGYTPLMLTATSGQKEIADMLVRNSKTDIMEKNNAGNNALHLAAYNGHAELIKILSTHSLLDINAKTAFDSTALALAIRQGHIEAAKALIADPRIDINLQNAEQDTALMQAISYGQSDIAKTLIADPRIDLNIQDQKGWTNLESAEMKMNYEMASLIQQTGKDTLSAERRHLKILGHSWELKGKVSVGGKEVKLTGYRTTLFVDFMAYSFKEFHRDHPDFISKEQFLTISQSLNSMKSFSPAKAISDFKNGMPVIISTGSTYHAISVVIHDSYLMICNKGEGSLRPIEAYKIDPAQLTEEMISTIIQCQSQSLEDGFNAFFGKPVDPDSEDSDRLAGPLLLALKAERSDKISKWLENLPHTTREQKVGNCAWESLETAVYATMGLLSVLKSDLPSLSPEQGNQMAEKTYESFSKWEKFTQLEAVIQSLRHIEEKILSKPESREDMLDASFLVRYTYLKDNNQDFWSKRRVIQAKLDSMPHLLSYGQLSMMQWTLLKVNEFILRFVA